MTQPATLEAVIDDVIALIEIGTDNAAALTADSALRDIGMDSLRLMALVFRIEARYDIELDATDGDDLRTVGDLARLVWRRIQERS